MAYAGKFVDRNPTIKTAGVIDKNKEIIGDALHGYSKEEHAENTVLAKCKQRALSRYRVRPRTPIIPTSELRHILSPELQKSRFIAFKEKFSEDLYFKKPELGKVYPLHSKPDHVTNENTTFGDALSRSESLYDLVLPKKSVDQVNREYIKWHDKYLLSHQHYLPSEQKVRHYNPEYFNRNATFGVKTEADTTGENVRRCLIQCNSVQLISKAQKDYIERTIGRLGRKMQKVRYDVPQDEVYGIRSNEAPCDVQSLMENLEPCAKKRQLIDALSHINLWRRSLFKRLDFHSHDLKMALDRLDEDKTGYLPLSKIYQAARSLQIRIEENKIRIALRHFNMIEDECLPTERVFYKNFWRLMTIQYPMPMTGNVSKMPSVVYNKDTTYRELCKDLEKEPERGLPVIKRPLTNDERTTAKDLIEPDIPMQYGLGPCEFEERRPKEELRRIFKRVLTDNFDQVWQLAYEKTKPDDCLLSVNDIREAKESILEAEQPAFKILGF